MNRHSAPAAPEVHSLRLPPGFDLLRLHELAPERYPFLLESVARGLQGRHDILMAWPGERLSLDASFAPGGNAGGGAAVAGPPNGFLPALDAWWERERRPEALPDLPFAGGWFVFLAYELASEIEPSIIRRAEPGLPVATAVRVPVALVRDHAKGKCVLVAEAGHAACVADVERDIAAAAARPVPAEALAPAVQVREPPEADFLRAVAEAQAHIAAGDIYQANLSRRWSARLRQGVSPAALYRRLRRTNPAPFAALARLGDTAIVSSSPERLVRVREGRVDTRPIAGTRPRAGVEDEVLRELLASPKERAEHVMLIDLERNDLGRICAAGSVRVNEFMVTESYAHVHHIVSNVEGRLRGDITPGGVIRAVFPGGTITGCPKVRCMELIRGLEAEPRGAYTGALGYLGRDGRCDLNILIRSIVQRGDEAWFSAGSGIVADSDPGRELEETRAKARGMRLALEGPAR